jgi:prepilin-type N-terminal cleavage/methylation domain-containing protein
MGQECTAVFVTNKTRTINRRSDGFSLLELVIAAAIVLLIAAIAVPQVRTAMNRYQLTSSASQLAGLIQQCRINSIRTNSVIAVETNGAQQVWANLDGDNPVQYDPGEPSIILPATVTLQGAGFPGNATGGLGAGINWQVNAPVRFNARGIPCRLNLANACIDAGSVGYVYYVRNRRGNDDFWAAVRVTPAGRVSSVMWSGSSYQ